MIKSCRWNCARQVTAWMTLVSTLLVSISVAAAQAHSWLGLPDRDSHAAFATANRAKIKLGAKLFADKRLSADGRISCANCHLADHAFTDSLPQSIGHEGRAGTRNAPSLLNVAYLEPLFRDGRADDLVAQARAPFTNPVEHALADEAALLSIVRADRQCRQQFAGAFGVEPAAIRMETVVQALVAFERTLLAGDSPFDRFFHGGEQAAMSEPAKRGLELFRGRAACTDCHLIGNEWSLLTDRRFHLAARGIPAAVTRKLPALAIRITAAKRTAEFEALIATDPSIAALGRYVATLSPADIGKFKTPSLRNVALTAPYMHDGSVGSLAEAVDLELYSRGAISRPIVLTRAEKNDMLEFLHALTSTSRK